MKPGTYFPRNTDLHGEQVLKLSAVLAAWRACPRPRPTIPAPGGSLPSQSVALNLSDAIWLETRWRHNWVKTCVTGKESPQSRAPHCVVLPAGPREGALGHVVTSDAIMSLCEHLHPHTHGHPQPRAQGHPSTEPDGRWPDTHETLRRVEAAVGGSPVLLWRPGQGPRESVLCDGCESQFRNTHARPRRSPRQPALPPHPHG